MRILVCGRSSALDSQHYNQKTIGHQIIKDSVVARTTAPGSRLGLEASDIAGKWILAHRLQNGFNPPLIVCGKPSEVFLCGLGYEQIPHHG